MTLLQAFSICIVVLAITLSEGRTVTAFGQSDGQYDLTHNVSAGGGDSGNVGGMFFISSTVGQPAAGKISSDSRFSLYSGFWSGIWLAPTAASESISGRVEDAQGIGIPNATLILVDATGNSFIGRSNSLGNYRFDGLEAGRTYILQIEFNRYSFGDPIRVINLLETRINEDFVGIE